MKKSILLLVTVFTLPLSGQTEVKPRVGDGEKS